MDMNNAKAMLRYRKFWRKSVYMIIAGIVLMAALSSAISGEQFLRMLALWGSLGAVFLMFAGIHLLKDIKPAK